MFICRQKINFTQPSPPPPPCALFWRYYKDMQSSYFGYFGQAWLDTPKMTVSTCRKLQCLSAYQKQTSSFTSFLIYYILKNPAISLAASILAHNSRTRILPDVGLVVNNNISFHFRLFPRKTNDKIFQKIQKNLFWGHLGPFLPRWGQKWIFLKKGICQFLDIPIIYHRAKNQKKILNDFWDKRRNDEWTDGQTTVIL